MSDLLALQWDRRRPSGLFAAVQKGSVRLRGGFVAEWPADLDLDRQPVQAGKWLADELAHHQIDCRQVSVVIPREDCSLRKLDLPDVPNDELPGVVRLQAAMVSSIPLDRLLLDYLPLPQVAGETGRSVLLATINRERFDSIRATLSAAGLECVSVGLAPVATAELAAYVGQRRGDNPAETSLTLVHHGDKVELSLVRDCRLILAHTAELPHGNPQQARQRLLAEISRLFVSLGESSGAAHVHRFGVVGGEDDLLIALRQKFDCPVERFDPLGALGPLPAGRAIHGDLACYAAPAGELIAAAGQAVDTVDFLNPHRPPEKKDLRRQRLTIAAIAAVVLFGLGFAIRLSKLSGLDSAIAALQQREREQDAEIKNGLPVLTAAGLIDDWSNRRVDWLSQFQRMNELMPGTSQLYWTGFRADLGIGETVARIRATGHAKERNDVDALYQRLAENNYRVRPKEITLNPRDPKYPYRFELDMDLVTEKPPGTTTTASRP